MVVSDFEPLRSSSRQSLVFWAVGVIGCLLFCGCPNASKPAGPVKPDGTPVAKPDTPVPPPVDPPKAAQGEWTPLFDGKTLTNWKVTDFGLPGECKVDNGMLLIGPGTRLAGISWTGGALPKMDYEISAEAQRVNGEDFFFGLTFPVDETHCSFITGGWAGRVVGLSSVSGEDASENETNTEREFQTGKWYRMRVRVMQNRIQAWIDDDRVVNLNTTDKSISVRLEMELQFPLGLATYKTQGAVRDLKYRKLTAAELAAPDPMENSDAE